MNFVILNEVKDPRISLSAPQKARESRHHARAQLLRLHLVNTFHRLYTGVTNDLEARVHDHKHPTNPNSFTARYNINHLVYLEHFQYIDNAIRREKQIKGWLRVRKIALIVEHNPTRRDLSEDWGKPILPFNASMRKAPTTF